jgi:hypothetical protein
MVLRHSRYPGWEPIEFKSMKIISWAGAGSYCNRGFENKDCWVAAAALLIRVASVDGELWRPSEESFTPF